MPAPKAKRLTGSCLCEAVQYTVVDAFTYALNCHCSQCRRATGAAFKPLAGIERSKLRITRGACTLLLPAAHIYVGSKAPWHRIDDALPQHLELPR